MISSTRDQQNEQHYSATQYETDYNSSTDSDHNYHKPTTKIGKNSPYGDACIDIDEHNQDVLQIYCQNVNGIFNTEGTGLDEAFHIMRSIRANIFTCNKIDDNDLNPLIKKV